MRTSRAKRRNDMGRFATLTLLVMLGLAPIAPCWAQDANTPEAVDRAWVMAMKANDVAAVMKCYAPDAVVWLPGAPTARGEQAIRAMYEGMFSANTVRDATVTEVQERMAGGTAVRWGKFSLTLAPKSGGEPAVLSGRFTEVVERRDGRWVYIVDHASPEPPPAGAK
jgi:uncharacterized protein (TIGR02246 family)